MSDRSRSSSPARSRSRSSSRSVSRSPSRSRSRSISSSSSSSPRFVSATDSENEKQRSPPPSPKKTKRTKKASPRSSANDDSDSEQDEPKKKPKRPPPKKKGKAKQESEEGEISSEDNSDMEEFDDGYDDDLIGDDEDRAKLEKMTEREREEILFKRAEDREYAKKQFEIRKKLKQKEKSRAKNESHESQDFDAEIDYNNVLDTKERSQTRQKKMEEKKLDQKSSALSELKAKRQEKERKDAERQKKEEAEEERKSRSKRGRSSSSESSSGSERSRSRSGSSSRSSSGSGSDTERFKKSPSKVQKYIETQEDMEPIRLSRYKLEKFVQLPIFSKLVMNCFCRIGIGQHQGKSVYRAAEIVDVVETGKVYDVGKQRTNIGLKLKFGKQERVFRLQFISNQHVMPQEFAKWKEACEEANVPLPTIESVKAKAKEIKQAMNYSYTNEDVDKIIAQKEKFQRHPVNYAMTKARLIKEKDIATANGLDEQANEYENKLKELEDRAEELDKKRTATISTVALVNDRNRKQNLKKAEEALLAEAKKRAEEGSNPFSRKKCNPRMVTKTLLEKKKVEKENVVRVAETSVSAKRKAEEDDKSGSAAGGDSDKAKKKAKFGIGLPLAMQKEDLFDAHNFDIEIDVNTDNMGVDVSSPAIPAPISIRPTTTSGDRKRSLNLDDYKKKRGLI